MALGWAVSNSQLPKFATCSAKANSFVFSLEICVKSEVVFLVCDRFLDEYVINSDLCFEAVNAFAL
jgi:hypothetical protein